MRKFMHRRFLWLFLVPFLLNACIQIGNHRYPVYESQTYSPPGKSQFSSGDLNAYRKSGSYYKNLNAKRNSHLPKAKSYTVLGKTYTPYASAVGFEEIGIASWYGPGFHGKKTSNGEIFNTRLMTAAHKLLPFNTNVLVTNLENGKSCVVRVNDRGPFVEDRIIDLSEAAAERLGMIKNGTAKVHLQYVSGTSAGTQASSSQASSQTDDGDEGFFSSLFGGGEKQSYAERNAVYSDKDQSVSEALASLAGGSASAGSAGYSSNHSMPQVNKTYTNTAPYASGSAGAVAAPNYGTPYSGSVSSPSYQTGAVQSGQIGSNTVIGSLYLHLVVYEDKLTAERLQQELRKRNIPSQIFYDNGFYLVQAGPFDNKNKAVQVQQYLKKNFPKAYLVVR